jgi:hypothetical protein
VSNGVDPLLCLNSCPYLCGTSLLSFNSLHRMRTSGLGKSGQKLFKSRQGLCKECHASIHDLIPEEKDLADKYNTKELLLENEAIRKHVAWVQKQK